jgi:hypothetical protein
MRNKKRKHAGFDDLERVLRERGNGAAGVPFPIVPQRPEKPTTLPHAPSPATQLPHAAAPVTQLPHAPVSDTGAEGDADEEC